MSPRPLTPDILDAIMAGPPPVLPALAAVTTIAITAIVNDGGTQMRAGMNADTVKEYEDALTDAEIWPFPPVVVYHDGAKYWLADGFHRLNAAHRSGKFQEIPADIKAGTRRDAVLYHYTAAFTRSHDHINATAAASLRPGNNLLPGWLMSQEARTLFAEFTYLGHDDKWKSYIFDACMRKNHIALIDYDAELGWVFHSLQHPQHDQVWKKDIAARFEEPRHSPAETISEAQFESRLCEALQNNNVHFRRQVWCTSGRIDVVTMTSIVEIKLVLDRSAAFSAIGQVLTYRSALSGSRAAVIVAGSISAAAEPIIHAASALGITVRLWNGIDTEIAKVL